MKSRPLAGSAQHPKPTELALYATGDLPLLQRVALRWHLRSCASCRNELTELGRAIIDVQSGAVRQAMSIAPVLDWSALEREMVGNIGVGLAAARCIDKVGTHRNVLWRGALLVSVLAVLFTLGWFTHVPGEQNQHLLGSVERLFHRDLSPSARFAVRAETQQLGLGTGAAGITFFHPPALNTASYGDSQLDVRYLDEETGEVTLLTVAAGQTNGPQ